MNNPNYMADSTLNSVAGNGNRRWLLCNHDRKPLIGPKYKFAKIAWHSCCMYLEFGRKTCRHLSLDCDNKLWWKLLMPMLPPKLLLRTLVEKPIYRYSSSVWERLVEFVGSRRWLILLLVFSFKRDGLLHHESVDLRSSTCLPFRAGFWSGRWVSQQGESPVQH